MEEPSSSKVHVEYFDPYNLYRLLDKSLLHRLPLRNLHWESHSGPLRSIPSLHIELIPSNVQISPLSTTQESFSNAPPLSRVKSEDSAKSGDDGFKIQAVGQLAVDTPTTAPKTPIKGRRHQIPGLRQTPYLKVLFVRCDDNDTYKEARATVREWLKEHTLPTQSTSKANAQENHDAFEWLIVHVIIPNTAASTQPRTSNKSDSGIGSAAEKSAAARWRGGGASTILDKLRADFNGSSKSAKDRVAQIRIGINDVPYDELPRVVPAIPGSYIETPQENENAWLDLILKLKEQILSSFDMRVSQYEEDIRETDARRTLPGWNFNTFFMLKEGLARGFESVGLVEDALVGYDQLAVGLDMIIREQAVIGQGVQHGGSFLPYTEDLKELVSRAKAAVLEDLGEESDIPVNLQTSDESGSNLDEIPLNAVKKRYRDLILANNISVFDFRCYLFARQLSLLLRLANAWSSQEELLAKLKEQRESSLQGVAARLPASQPAEDVENLSILGEVCKRSMDFIASISRIMRDDIASSQRPSNDSGSSDSQLDPIITQVTDNIVSSFTFSVAQQILAQTSTKALPIPPSTLAPPSSKIPVDGQESKAAIPEPKTMMHPARSTSLAIRSPTMRSQSRSREPLSPGLGVARRASVPERASVSSSSQFLKSGLEELAAHRAGLYLLSRNIMEDVGKERKWSSGWSEVSSIQYGDIDDMDDIDLSDESTDGRDKPSVPLQSNPIPPSSHGIDSKLLRVAVDNRDDYYRLYETLTDKALRHYSVANHVHSQHSSMVDLAVLKFYLKDYAAAASYFYQITPEYSESGWSQIELSMLVLYSDCLRKLQRKEEFVRVVLKLLTKTALVEKERIAAKSTFKVGRMHGLSHAELVPAEPYLEELLGITKTLQRDHNVPLQSFFGFIEVDGTPRYHPEQDSIALQVRLQYLLAEDLIVEKVKVRIARISGDTTRDIWLESEGPVTIKNGIAKVMVQSNIIIPGIYVVNHCSLYASYLIFKYESENIAAALGKNDPFFKCPKLLIFQQPDSFDIQLFASRHHQLDRPRSLEIELSSGRNDVQGCALHIRAATAGLRVLTSEAVVAAGKLEISKKTEASILRFKGFESGKTVKIKMPFSLEHDVTDISVKLEITYTTKKGDFTYATNPSMSIMLPLGVNVQDIFKHRALFSRFSITSSTTSPLRLLSTKLEDSEYFKAECGTAIKPLMVFPRQPASMLYKISPQSPRQGVLYSNTHKAKMPLSLILQYICIEEEIDNAITQSLNQAFKGTPLFPYIRLLLPVVLGELQKHMLPYELEKIALLGEISTSILTDVSWQSKFAGLGQTVGDRKDIATLLSDTLQKWQSNNPTIPLEPLSTKDIATSRSITIPVEIPPVTIVHTADLKLTKKSTVPAHKLVVPAHQPIAASLFVKCTRIWDTEPHLEADGTSLPHELAFVYEITGASDTWLIGGRRKGNFKFPSSTTSTNLLKFEFPVILIPLREGFLPFPHVEIKAVPAVRVLGADVGEGANAVVSCETDYRNAGETLRVISDAVKTTVSLDASGPQGGAWLLESERRGRDGGEIRIG